MSWQRVLTEHRKAARYRERQNIAVRRAGGWWCWKCQVCGWVGVDLYTQRSALHEGLRHLQEASQ